ncbi:hypothetical protein Lalb_Chr02g0146081 [Lupinus albus]|uniref:Uncharacterized protein n=1 Tax=Lupinus albus TaxID=3870 RepID=A0A6A4QY80_LUPAL|nr:hypothetical protein Lalb_Chr02g0146081 [Lupinus albus]
MYRMMFDANFKSKERTLCSLRLQDLTLREAVFRVYLIPLLPPFLRGYLDNNKF